MLLIPFTSDPANLFTVQLGDGNKYDFETRFNQTPSTPDAGGTANEGFWTLDLTRSVDQVRLATGIPILLGQDLLAGYALSMGRLIAIDENGSDLDAGPDDLGVRVNVYWFADGEIVPPAPSLTFIPSAPPGIPAAPAFTPIQLGSTLKLWLRGDLGITQGGGTVSAWADQSGNGNDVTQPTGGNQPAFAASSINGRPAVTFAANKFLQNTLSNLVAAGGARTVFAVVKASSASGQQTIISMRPSTGATFAFSIVHPANAGGGRAAVYSDFAAISQLLTLPSPTVLNIPIIGEYKFNGTLGTQLQYSLNGVSLPSDTGAVSNAETGSTGFLIGSDTFATDYLIGDLCELVVCDTQLSPANELRMKTYLSTWYAIAVS